MIPGRYIIQIEFETIGINKRENNAKNVSGNNIYNNPDSMKRVET